MMYLGSRKAFTMLELIFVIVVIGILASIAIPKFAANRSDAVISKAKATVAAIRNAVAGERQKRVLQGNFNTIQKLSSASGYDVDIFDGFDGDTNNPVLEYPLRSCKNGQQECWVETATGSGTESDPSEYTFYMPVTGTVVFQLINNKFNCETPSDPNCIKLTR